MGLEEDVNALKVTVQDLLDQADALRKDLESEKKQRQADFLLAAPIGTIVAFGGATIPTGWLLCDGTPHKASDNPLLFQAIGTAWGNGGGNGFNLPQLRGRFLRGMDAGAIDPDYASRTRCNPGGNTGSAVGSVQDHAYSSHAHGVSDPGHTHGYNHYTHTGGPDIASGIGGPVFNDNRYTTAASRTNVTIQQNGGNETRPVNAYVNWIIRAS